MVRQGSAKASSSVRFRPTPLFIKIPFFSARVYLAVFFCGIMFSIMKLKNIAYLVFTLLAISTASAVENVSIVAKKSGKIVSTNIVKLENTDDGAKRLLIKKENVPTNIDILEIYPDSAVANKGDEGYFIFSRGEYINFTRDNYKLERVRNVMPVFGAKTKKETFVAIGKTMRHEYSVNAIVENGVHKIYIKFLPKKIAGGIYEDIVFDFYTLTGDDANYSGMGRKYRQLRLASNEIVPIKERIKTNKHLAESWDRILARLVVCGVMPTPKNDNLYFKELPPVRVIASFDTQKEIIGELKKAGIKEVSLVLAGWQRGGFNGCCPDIFPIPEEFGGEAKLRELVKYAKDNGYPLTPNADHTCAYYCANMWDKDYVIKRQDNGLREMGIFGGGRMHYICLKRSWELFIKKQMQQIKDLGFDGSYYIDVFSARPPDECFDKNHFATKQDIAKVQNEIFAYARELFGSAYSEGGYDHCIGSIESANYTSGMDFFSIMRRKEQGLEPLFDGIYPLWEIVYHGIILSTPGRTTQNNVIECFFKKDIFKQDKEYDPWKPLPEGWTESETFKTRMLRLVEWGARPAIYDLTTATIPELKAMYDFYEQYKHLQLEFMDSHQEIANGIFLVKYSNKTDVVVNYTDKPFEYKKQIVAPKSFKLIK